MKKILLSAMVAALVWAGSTASAMTADDIIQLCKAGFTPQRIAKIVDATGLDRPLVAADWARIRNDGCDDRVVDALLEVLVPADENSTEDSGETESKASDQTDQTYSNINVYLHSDWGWDNWYGGFGWGWYDPFWSVGWSTWDPYWAWAGWGTPWYWYADDWWGHPYRHRFGCGPFYYHDNWYNGGYNWSGRHERHKEYRHGSMRDSYYADIKTPQTVQRGLITKAVAIQTSSVSTVGSYGLRSKSAKPFTTRIVPKGTVNTGAYTTRTRTAGQGLTTRETLRAKGSGTPLQGKSSTQAGRYGTIKTQGRSSGSTPSGNGNEGTYSRQRPKSSGTTVAPPPPSTKQKGTPPSAPAGKDGGKGSVKQDGGSTQGTGEGTRELRRKG